jgi:hypothetical protein
MANTAVLSFEFSAEITSSSSSADADGSNLFLNYIS